MTQNSEHYPEILYFYRQRPGSIMTTFSTRHIDDRIAFMRDIDKFVSDKVLKEEAIDRRKVMQGVYAFLLDHAKYGRALIDSADEDLQESYHRYYSDCLVKFSEASQWGQLVFDCYRK